MAAHRTWETHEFHAEVAKLSHGTGKADFTTEETTYDVYRLSRAAQKSLSVSPSHTCVVNGMTKKKKKILKRTNISMDGATRYAILREGEYVFVA